jgi:tetratricopeptide (TPR) repeat protein
VRRVPALCVGAAIVSCGAVVEAQPTGRADASSSPIGAVSRAVTFHRDVAPILRERCAGCHQPGGGAPFPLLEYRDARRRASLIARVTATRYMPPWKPQQGHGTFANDRRLTDAQIALLEQWANSGALEGSAAESTADRTSTEPALGPPDIVLTMPEPFMLPADGADTIRSFVIPGPPGRGRYVAALDFRPGDSGAVHHANIKLDSSGSSRRLDADDPVPGFEGANRDARFPDGYFLGWTPGQRPAASPEQAWYLPAGTDLIVELHLTPTGKTETVQCSVGLFLTDAAPTRTPLMIRLGSQRIDIAAGAQAHVSADRYTLPVDVDLLAVQPHAHHLARSVQGYARLPDGRRESLIDIRDWDFRWQDVYRYTHPVRLPRGTVLEVAFTYDNSSANPRNPNQPPRRVRFGQTSAAEMGDLWLQVVTADPGDRLLLDRDYRPKMLNEDVAGDETMLAANPTDASLRMDLALCYLAAGRADEAVAQLEWVIEHGANPLAAHYELGRILLNRHRLDEAGQQFRRVLELAPDSSESYNNLGVIAYQRETTAEAIRLFGAAVRLRDTAEGRYNLGRALVRADRPDEAIEQYLAALRLEPDDADTHVGLGAILVARGDTRAALIHYRAALQAQPDFVSALTDLAWLLATSDDVAIRQPEAAVRLAERAARLTQSKNAIVLDTLAISYFTARRTDDAVRTARAAIDLALSANDRTMAERIRVRLQAYEADAPP